MSGYEDMVGNEITAGSLIAMPFTNSSMASLRVGRVVELIPSKTTKWSYTTPQKIRCEWVIKRGNYGPKKSIVENYSNSLVLPANFLDDVSGDDDGN